MPEQILTEGGKVFTGRLAPKPDTVAVDRICLNNGICHILTAPYSPTTTGKIERLHKTMRKELLAGRRFASIAQAQTEPAEASGDEVANMLPNLRKRASPQARL